MEKVFQLELNGQQVQKDDFNILGTVSGLADDRVFAELLRMTPYDGSTVSRGILPFHLNSGTVKDTVGPSGADGSVIVQPFRAFIGSRTAEATEARDNWHDIRSGLSVAEADTDLQTTLTFAANSSGDNRWDLVYAAVAVDADDETVTRKQKDSSTLVISDQTVVITKISPVVVAIQMGTPSATPAWPAVPSDSGGTYYIPLAYVRIPDGFNGTATVAYKDIAPVAPVLRLSSATGAKTLSIADQQYTVGGSVISTSDIAAWGNANTARPAAWIPGTASGGESLIVYADLTTGSESHADNAVVDSRDWRNRLVKWTVALSNAIGDVTTSLSFNSEFRFDDLTANGFQSGLGSTLSSGTAARTFLSLTSDEMGSSTLIAGAGLVTLYADDSDSGKLKIHYSGAPNTKIMFWLDFSGPLEGNV